MSDSLILRIVTTFIDLTNCQIEENACGESSENIRCH